MRAEFARKSSQRDGLGHLIAQQVFRRTLRSIREPAKLGEPTSGQRLDSGGQHFAIFDEEVLEPADRVGRPGARGVGRQCPQACGGVWFDIQRCGQRRISTSRGGIPARE